ncbi:MAG: TetR/AcrR family transcriptional regulator [Bacteroidota bacterium]
MEIKEKILEAAGELFAKYGVRSVTMDDIARSIAVSKKTIYQYFKDKDEIVTMATQAHMEAEKKDYDRIFSNASNAIEELARVLVCFRKHLSEMNPSWLFDLQKYHHNAWKVWLSFKNGFIHNSIEKNLKRGVAEGYFRSNLNTNILATFRVEQVQMTFDDRVFPRNKFDFTEVQLQLFDHFVYGLITDKGRELYEEYQKTNTENYHLTQNEATRQ